MGRGEEDEDAEEASIDDHPNQPLVQVGRPSQLLSIDKAVEGLVGQSRPKTAPPARSAASPRMLDQHLGTPGELRGLLD